MGEVYRARDTKLGRDVALKILPPAFTADADRVARFEREARLLASLNHPHIGAIYGFEDAGDVPALVLELVEGDTLDDRVRRGPLPLSEALAVAQQIADALDAAHGVRDHPSRSQALQHQDHARRGGQGARLRARESPRGRRVRAGSVEVPDHDGGRDERRCDSRHRGVHEPRAGARQGTWTNEPTSGHSGACSTRCSPAAPHFAARRCRIRSPPSSNARRTGQRCRWRRRQRPVVCCSGALEKDPRRRLRDIGDARHWMEDVTTGEADVGAAASASPTRGLAWLLGGVALASASFAGWLLWVCADRGARAQCATPTSHRFRRDGGVAGHFAGRQDRRVRGASRQQASDLATVVSRRPAPANHP